MSGIKNLLSCFVLVLTVIPAAAQVPQQRPLFSFGLIADVQYADEDPWEKRD